MTNLGFEIRETMCIHAEYSRSATDKVIEILYNGKLIQTYKMNVTAPFELTEKDLIDLLYKIHGVIIGKKE